MSVRSSDGRGPMPPPPQKRSRTGGAASGSGSASSSRATTPVTKPSTMRALRKPSLRVETGGSNDAPLYCMTCGLSDARDDLMQCCHCANVFHAKCANLPSVPEDGAFFCRWSCFASFHKPAALAQRGLSGDFPRLAAQIQLLLRERTKVPVVHSSSGGAAAIAAQPHTRQSPFYNSATASANGHDSHPPPLPTANASVDANAGVASESIGSGEPIETYGRHAHTRSGGDSSSSRQARHGRSAPPSPSRESSSSYGGGSRAHSADPLGALRDHRSSSRTSNDSAAFDVGFAREHAGSGRSSASPGAFAPSGLALAPGFAAVDSTSARAGTSVPRASHSVAMMRQPGCGAGAPGHLRGGAAPMSQSRLPTLQSVDSRQELDDLTRLRSSEYRGGGSHSSLDGTTRSRSSYGSGAHARGDPATAGSGRYMGHTRDLPPGEPPTARLTSNGKSRYASRPPHTAAPAPAKEADVPWLNPSAFPASMLERFQCHADDLNRVFRIDLTPAFADKTTHLYQSEIDFFFRCFESSDVSLVVKGMASELNPCMWTWPFLLESVGADACFTFDHFQYARKSGRESGSALEFAGELTLSLGEYSLYLDRFLAGASSGGGGSTNEAIVLEDRTKKETVTLLASDNVIALHSLVVAHSCAKLYSDLKNSFQWDVFAGGIHCLLQYLPESSRSDKFASPRLHFTFPGARGALCDPGNGTTDTAYQVLAGSLELVIFERMEPRHRDEFARILRRAGYQTERKPMLHEAHLRALSSAGFVWTTVKIHDGDFIHINKGRMHFWRAVARIAHTPARSSSVSEPCVFLSWEWVYQGVSQRGISTECWFAMKNASLCSGGWAFDPRRAIIEAAKTGVATVRSGQFLTARRSALSHALSFSAAASAQALALDAGAVVQRQMQMVLFLESILQCLKTIVDDEYDLAVAKDDTEVFSKRFDGEAMWKAVDADLGASHVHDASAYACGVCGLELANIYKQCLGCTAYASACQPNMSYTLFRLCLRCHAHPKHHHFKPRRLHGYFGKLLSCEGHTGAPQSALDPNFFECACAPSLPCGYCGGCQSCSCMCHTQFQTRFRFASPESLDRLRFDVEEVVKFHKQVAAGAVAAAR